jgi:hypothetical protein
MREHRVQLKQRKEPKKYCEQEKIKHVSNTTTAPRRGSWPGERTDATAPNNRETTVAAAIRPVSGASAESDDETPKTEY